MSEKISFTSRDGKTREGALSMPAAGAKAPGVIVIQEWWGINEQIKTTCDRFAAEGFVALAPDLYHGKVTADAGEAQHMMTTLDWAVAIEDLAGAIAHLRGHSSGKVCVAGYCMGGAATFVIATQVKGLAAVSPYYGVPPQADWSKVDAPVQAHFAQHDDWASPAKGEEIKKAIEAGGGHMELFVYDAQHAFMNEKRPEVYSPDNAATAWKRTVEFFRKHT
jgi:carboxymethylenebutenolidase